MEDRNNHEPRDRDEIYSNALKAGKRTYFFDVRKTRSNDLFLTITESKKKYNEDGTFHYQKHKIFLYKEDFDKFSGALLDTIKKVAEFQKEFPQVKRNNDYPDVRFEDLGNSTPDKS